MGRDHRNRGYIFRFTSNGKLERFIQLYRDIIVPYASTDYRQDRVLHDWGTGGILKLYSCDWFFVNLYPEDLRKIVKDLDLKKFKIGDHRYGYEV